MMGEYYEQIVDRPTNRSLLASREYAEEHPENELTCSDDARMITTTVSAP